MELAGKLTEHAEKPAKRPAKEQAAKVNELATKHVKERVEELTRSAEKKPLVSALHVRHRTRASQHTSFACATASFSCNIIH